ncbi:hypothetical protein D3C73_1016130 [compost metagenome]
MMRRVCTPQVDMWDTACSQRCWNMLSAPKILTVSRPEMLSIRLAFFWEARREPSSMDCLSGAWI